MPSLRLVRWSFRSTLVAVLLCPFLVARANGQIAESPIKLATRGPIFYSAAIRTGRVRDASDAPIFHQAISLDLRDASLHQALDSIVAAARVSIVYAAEVLPPNARVSLRAERISLAGALTVVLMDAGLDVQLTQDGILSLTRRASLIIRVARDTAGGPGAVAGRVFDAKSNEPIDGATVGIDGQSKRTLTSSSGRYALTSIPPGTYTLVAQRLGYTPNRVTVVIGSDSTTRADIALSMSAQVMEEVVTTATGDLARRAVGNAIATIRADSIVAKAPTTSLGDVLNGRAAGVQVYLNGGLTGASPEITIRGQNSFTLSTQPLLYIDGVRVDNTPAAVTNVGVTDNVSAGRFNDLDPQQIESIEIVKGPSASTLYGTDAANGVILVKTKRGHAGRPRWDVYGEHGLLTLDRSRLWNPYHAFGHDPATGTPVQCFNLDRVAGRCVLDSLTRFDPLRVPGLSPVSTGFRNEYGLQTSGGTSQARYFAAGGYEDETGVLKMPDADRAILTALRGAPLGPDELRPNAANRASARATLSTIVASTADLTLSGNLSRQHSRIPGPDVWAAGARGPGYLDANDGWNPNPGRPAQVLAERNAESVTHATPSATVDWHPFTWFTGHATGGLDFSSNMVDELLRAGEGVPSNATGSRANEKSDVSLYSVDLGGAASFNLTSWLDSKTAVGAQYNRRFEQDNIAEGFNLSPGATDVSGAATQIANETTVEAIVAGAYGEQTFALSNRLFLTGAARVDGGSAFGTAFKSAVYPKASVSWLLSEEPFMPHIPGLTSLRLRGAYGSSGVQPGSTAALPAVSLFPAAVGSVVTTGAKLSALGNPNLGPERQTEVEGGIDAELGHGRVRIEYSYFQKKSTDALVNLPVPTSVGLGGGFRSGTVQENIGSVQNLGYEGALTVRVIESRPVTFELNVNGSVTHNKLLSLAPGVTSIGFGTVTVGYPLFGFADKRVVSYADLNHNGVIEPNEVTISPTPVFGGSPFPKTQLSVAPTATFLNGHIQVSALFDYRGGFVVGGESRDGSIFDNNARAQNDPKAPLAEQAAAVGALYYGAFSGPGLSEDGSFTRFRELSITITPATSVAHHIFGARSASVTFAGRNLALWTKFSGVDPEINRDPGGFAFLGAANSYAYSPDAGAPPSQYWIVRVRLGW